MVLSILEVNVFGQAHSIVLWLHHDRIAETIQELDLVFGNTKEVSELAPPVSCVVQEDVAIVSWIDLPLALAIFPFDEFLDTAATCSFVSPSTTVSIGFHNPLLPLFLGVGCIVLGQSCGLVVILLLEIFVHFLNGG